MKRNLIIKKINVKKFIKTLSYFYLYAILK